MARGCLSDFEFDLKIAHHRVPKRCAEDKHMTRAFHNMVVGRKEQTKWRTSFADTGCPWEMRSIEGQNRRGQNRDVLKEARTRFQDFVVCGSCLQDGRRQSAQSVIKCEVCHVQDGRDCEENVDTQHACVWNPENISIELEQALLAQEQEYSAWTNSWVELAR